MYYFNSVKDKNNFVYSCDSIRLEFSIDINTLEKVCYFCNCNCDNYYMSFKTFSYKHCFTFNLSLDCSFTVLCGLNTYGRIKSVFVVDFNPNKCMQYDYFTKFMSYLYYLCYRFDINHTTINFLEIKRYDLAIDIPFPRQNVALYYAGKGAKLHESVCTTIFDKTDYYGERNSVGRLKVYNKSLEDIKKKSKAERELYRKGFFEDITRIEITHNTMDCNVLWSSLPIVYTNFDLALLDNNCSPIDYILVSACRNDSFYIPYLKQSRKKWDKLKKFIINESIDFDINSIRLVLSQICKYVELSTYFKDEYSLEINKKFYDNFFKSIKMRINPYFDEAVIDNDEFEEIVDDSLKPF